MEQKAPAGRIFAFRALAVLFTLAACFVIFAIAEFTLRKQGNLPGVLYNNFTFLSVADITRPIGYDQFIQADETGMAYVTRQLPWLAGTDQIVNEQGFVGTFNYDKHTIDSLRGQGKKIVFIIGDSFVQGVADHTDSIFVARLRQQHPEWAICSFGVGATGLVNYLLIMRKFVAELKPDLVVLAICWNDILWRKGVITPCIPPVWQTDLGWVESVIPAEMVQNRVVVTQSPNEAVRFYIGRLTLFYRDDWKSKVCRQSSLLTRLYKRYSKKDRLADWIIDPLANERLLTEMAQIAEREGSKLVMTFIPDPRRVDRLNSVHENRVWYEKNFRSFTKDIHFSVGSITEDDYISRQNQHFNDVGNRKYAAFLDSVIAGSLVDLNAETAEDAEVSQR